MISGQGIIGKLIDLLITKIAGKKLDLFLEDRKRVCRMFAEYYFALVRLDDISKSLVFALRETCEARNSSAFVGRLATLAPSIDGLSQQFLDLGDQLEWVAKLYDEVLWRALRHLDYHKFSLLVLLSHSIELRPLRRIEPTKVRYLKPSPYLLSIDMEQYYQWVMNHPDHDSWSVEPSQIDWPVRLLESLGYDEAFKQVNISLSDYAALKQLGDVLETHSRVLEEAIEKLRSFITSNFKVDEIFSVVRRNEREGF